MRKAKIVCTIGPASVSPAMLDRLIAHGMDAARLNFSHGTHASHAVAIAAIREAAERRHATVAIIQDLQGPRIRVGTLPEEGAEVRAGQSVRLLVSPTLSGERGGTRHTRSSPALVQEIPITYPFLTRDVQPDARILINDGLIELRATQVVDGSVDCIVVTGGTVLSHKGVNLPGTAVSAPTLTGWTPRWSSSA